MLVRELKVCAYGRSLAVGLTNLDGRLGLRVAPFLYFTPSKENRKNAPVPFANMISPWYDVIVKVSHQIVLVRELKVCAYGRSLAIWFTNRDGRLSLRVAPFFYPASPKENRKNSPWFSPSGVSPVSISSRERRTTLESPKEIEDV